MLRLGSQTMLLLAGIKACLLSASQFAAMPPVVPEGWIHLPIAVARVSDDDGGRLAEVTAQDVYRWIEFTNKTYERARIRLSFDPAKDAVILRSSLLNRMMGTGDADWQQAKQAGRQLSRRFPGKVLLIIRHGPNERPIGGGFSWTDYPFVALSRAGSSTPNVLAHEVGHYLGLAHTWSRSFRTLRELEEFLRTSRQEQDSFDGDNLLDTSPTPFVEELAERSLTSFSSGGYLFKVDLGNIMSFYNGPSPMRANWLSPSQIDRVRWVATARLRNSMETPVNTGVTGVIEAETLTAIVGGEASAHVQSLKPYGEFLWSGDKQLTVRGSKGGHVDLIVESERSERVRLVTLWTMAPDYGVVSVSVNGVKTLDSINLYSASVSPSGPVDHGIVELQAGRNTVRFTIEETRMGLKNGRECLFGVDALKLVRLE
jgi:hypothetical protein